MSKKGTIYATTYDFHDEENVEASNDIKTIKKIVKREGQKWTEWRKTLPSEPGHRED